MLHIEHPPTYLPERRYIHDVMLAEFLGLDYTAQVHEGRDVRLRMAGDPHGRVLVLPDVFFQAPEPSWLTENTLPKEPLQHKPLAALPGVRAVAPDVPVLYGREGSGDGLLWQNGDETVLGVDILGSAFFMLTRYEELVKPERDRHGRFPAQASIAAREGFLERPLVNEYLELLWFSLRRLWPGLERRQRRHRVYLTHDVDQPLCVAGRSPACVLRSAVADVLQRRDAALVPRRLRAWVQSRRGTLDGDPANTFDFAMDQSEGQGRRSAFYFMAQYGQGAARSLGHPWLRSLLRRIGRRGHEVGVHLSYHSYADPAAAQEESRTIMQIAAEEGIRQDRWGGRQHYLRWENPTTWDNWEAAGLGYDSTLGHAETAGFRCGTCYEFPVFNLKARQALRLVERPLTAMDGALLQAGLNLEEACIKILHLNAICRVFDGDLTLLWHNHKLMSRQERHCYSEIVRSL